MKYGKDLLKKFVLNLCSPQFQRKLRRFYLSWQVTKNRGFREPEIGILKSLVIPGDFVADVGANVGVYTKELSSLVGDKGQVYAFEPIGENYDILNLVIRKACLSNVRPFQAALGSYSRQCEMVIPELGGFTGYYWAHIAKPDDPGRRETVNVLALDELWDSGAILRLHFIKCDVEGAELEVVKGGLKLIRSLHPAWLLEVSGKTSDQIFGILHELGYHAFVYDQKLIPTEYYRNQEFSNYFFLHPSSECWGRIYKSTDSKPWKSKTSRSSATK